MITEEERQSIIAEAVEKALLALPNVVGQLMMQQATYSKLNNKFYNDHPEFKAHKEVVVAAIEMVDGQNPTLGYEEKLAKALPEIKKRIEMKLKLNMKEAKRPQSLSFERSLEAVRLTDHGDI